MKKLDKRLSALAEFVRAGASVCDVGTDHALLPCYLAGKGDNPVIYACDINPKPLQIAKAEIERQNAAVTLIQSDGLLNVPPCDDVIIAGMGGELIAEIAEKCPFKNRNLRLITQPMTRHEDLRRGLYKSGYRILSEKVISENNRLFIIIYAEYTGEKAELDCVTAYAGNSGDSRYLQSRIELLHKKAKGDSRYLEIAKKIQKLIKLKSQAENKNGKNISKSQ